MCGEYFLVPGFVRWLGTVDKPPVVKLHTQLKAEITTAIEKVWGLADIVEN